jgi:hypothetical protein
MNARYYLLLLAVVGAPFWARPELARAEDIASAGRRILAAHQNAVVTVKLVIGYNVSLGGRDQQGETRTEAVGTVINPSGLTVISLSTIDTSELWKSRMRGAAQSQLKVEMEVKDAKIMLADGTEIPAEVVLRDKDLDLAFLRPTEKPARPLAAIDLATSAKPQVLDEVICLNRLGKIANRVVAVSIERIDALVERPRPFFVLSPGGSSGVGSPVFAGNGALLGIILIRNAPTDGDANVASYFSASSGSYGFFPVIVPAADILEDAHQALEAKKPAAAEEEKK